MDKVNEKEDENKKRMEEITKEEYEKDQCDCGISIVQDTVKRGHNKGRLYNTCRTNECGYFRWVENDKPIHPLRNIREKWKSSTHLPELNSKVIRNLSFETDPIEELKGMILKYRNDLEKMKEDHESFKEKTLIRLAKIKEILSSSESIGEVVKKNLFPE